MTSAVFVVPQWPKLPQRSAYEDRAFCMMLSRPLLCLLCSGSAWGCIDLQPKANTAGIRLSPPILATFCFHNYRINAKSCHNANSACCIFGCPHLERLPESVSINDVGEFVESGQTLTGIRAG